jgi:hypothetical protein
VIQQKNFCGYMETPKDGGISVVAKKRCEIGTLF